MKKIILTILVLFFISCGTKNVPVSSNTKGKIYKVTLYSNFGDILEVKYATKIDTAFDAEYYQFYYYGYEDEFEYWDWYKHNVKIELVKNTNDNI